MIATRLISRPFVFPKHYRLYSSVSVPQTPQPLAQDDAFHRVDLRVGKIVDVALHPDAEHLYIETVDVGEAEPRTIVSGLVKYVSKDDLQNKRVIVAANMKPSRFRGVLSQGMLLAASSSQDPLVVDLLTPHAVGPLGERVQLQDLVLAMPDAVLNPKKKVFEQVAQYLKTDKDGVATYKDLPLTTEAGPVTSKCVKLGQVS
ncbi:hypothetical protein [Absidia glauca]|uniref:tRNA-binding domain-containing protein n=1 Tax=Absidia glauca TaxID=4829 RepID=A0A168P5E7_ABSGL|nr:hypothetical protein [Absidia glauca]